MPARHYEVESAGYGKVFANPMLCDFLVLSPLFTVGDGCDLALVYVCLRLILHKRCFQSTLSMTILVYYFDPYTA